MYCSFSTLIANCYFSGTSIQRLNICFYSISDVEVVCTNYEGIDAIKRALRKGLELSTETMPIKVTLMIISITICQLFLLPFIFCSSAVAYIACPITCISDRSYR